jgi:uncharacterized protein with von Willebrand factor type A (vWA) domain
MPSAMPDSPRWSATMANDLAEVAARFGAALRLAGLPVGPGRCERFAAAVALARPQTPRALYLCAAATLVSSKAHAATLESVFSAVFGGLADQAGQPGGASARVLAFPPARTPEDMLASAARAAREHAGRLPPSAGGREIRPAEQPDRPPGGPERTIEDRFLGSAAERLAAKDFAELSPDELTALADLMRRITLAVPLRRSRRQRRRRRGPHPDMRATLRRARRTGGDPVHLIGRAPVRRQRRLVVLCDISGSMEPYARAMIQLLYCAAGGARAEVFSFATRLTRLTGALSGSRPARRHQDRRLAEGLQQFLRTPRDGPRRRRSDHFGRLGHRRPRRRPARDGAAVAGRVQDRVGEPADEERRLPAAGRRHGGRVAVLRCRGERAHAERRGRPRGRARRPGPAPGGACGPARRVAGRHRVAQPGTRRSRSRGGGSRRDAQG